MAVLLVVYMTELFFGVQGIIGGVRAARGGHDVIMSPTSHCYFDYKQSMK